MKHSKYFGIAFALLIASVVCYVSLEDSEFSAPVADFSPVTLVKQSEIVEPKQQLSLVQQRLEKLGYSVEGGIKIAIEDPAAENNSK